MKNVISFTSRQSKRRRFIVYRTFYLSLLISFLVPGCVLRAQVITGAISGTVSDSTGAAMPGATVIVTNQGTAISHSLTTDDRGFYSAEGLSDGDYTVTVSKEGFDKVRTSNIHLAPGQRYAQNVALKVGTASTTVSVTADMEQVNTETAESGGTLESKQISNLMLNGRNFQTMALAVPGVSSTAASNQLGGGGLTASTTLIINGSGVNLSGYTIDGIYDMNSGNYSALDVNPPVDGIAEFTVLKDNYSARYGMVL